MPTEAFLENKRKWFSFFIYLYVFYFVFFSSALITYIESDKEEESEPVWRGYFYAFLMLICAQVQSFLLAQYFMKMFIVGLQIRTGVISAVYRKVGFTLVDYTT